MTVLAAPDRLQCPVEAPNRYTFMSLGGRPEATWFEMLQVVRTQRVDLRNKADNQLNYLEKIHVS